MKRGNWKDVNPVRAGAYIRTHTGSDATVKQHLAALRTLYDWMSSQGAARLNPFATVRGPKLSRQTGSTPDLTAKEVQRLFDAIDTKKLAGSATARSSRLCSTLRTGLGRRRHARPRIYPRW